MEIFFSRQTEGGKVLLDPEESTHCLRVLRHSAGDEVNVVDGLGNMMRCRLTGTSLKGAEAEILETVPGWGGHPYHLNMAVCPTKNNDRFEWFVEKATEIGVDKISPVIGDHSERRIFKTERSKKIALSAMKQSLKAKLPEVEEPVSVRDFILTHKDPGPENELKLIACCFEEDTPRESVLEALSGCKPDDSIVILIGPEGDFSREEAALAIGNGFIPIHLGPSRLRTETAAIAAATACYLHFPLDTD